MWEDTQRRTDYERGRADIAERFRSIDWAPLPPDPKPMRSQYADDLACLKSRGYPVPLYDFSDSETNQEAIEAAEVLANRGGIPPLPTTKVTLWPSK